MCHMRVNEKYRVWHGLDHQDDAVMMPLNFNHIDGYISDNSTRTKFKPGDRVPGLDAGGWHDAGDYDCALNRKWERYGCSRLWSKSLILTTMLH